MSNQTMITHATVNNFMKNKQRGAQLLDMSLTSMVVIGALVTILLMYPTIAKTMKKAAFQRDAAMIIAAADAWKMARSNFTGVGMGELCKGSLPKNGSICGTANTGTGTNHYGGNWTLTVGSNPGLLQLTSTFPNDPDVIPQLADAMAPSTRANCQESTGCSSISSTTSTLVMTY
ncbi:hypothetical protein V8687_03925 [Shewanella baltica]|uniref:hypothetical protein n=1 Tax=Shewanella baltica TaxID=62322 RepID=UPI0030D49F3F